MAEKESGLGSSANLDENEGLDKLVVDLCSGIESRAKNLRLVSESLEKRERDLEKRERELSVARGLVEASQRKVEGVWRKEQDKLNKIERREREIAEYLKKLKELEGRVEGLRRREVDELEKIRIKESELGLKETCLLAWQKELEDKHQEIDLAHKSIQQCFENLDARQKNLTSLTAFTPNCEHLAIKANLQTEEDLVEERARDLVVVQRQAPAVRGGFEVRVKELDQFQPNESLQG